MRNQWRPDSAALAEGKEVMIAAGDPGDLGGAGGQHAHHGREHHGQECRRFGHQQLRLHDVPSVVIAGPRLFPTSTGVNPTFTAHARAARSAERVLAQWGRTVG